MRALSRKYAYRKSTLRNLATSLILYERITTTSAKAKELKPVIEKLLIIAKKNDLVARRRLLGYLFDKNATKKVIEVLGPRFKNIQSGFVKTYKLAPRLGDGAEMMIIEFVKIKEVIDPSTTLGVKSEDAKKENRAEKTRKTTTKSAKGETSPSGGKIASKTAK